MSRGSSRRWILAPTSWVTAMSAAPRRDLGLPGRRPAHRLGCALDGLDDVHVARTPAEVAFEAPANLVFGRDLVLFEKVGRRRVVPSGPSQRAGGAVGARAARDRRPRGRDSKPCPNLSDTYYSATFTPEMQLENSFSVDAPPDRVFAYLLDINKVVGCVPGAELSEVVDSTTFKGKVKIKVGPITVAYNGTARIADRDDAGRSAAIEAEGRETTGPGSARAKALMKVDADGAGSVVKISTDYSVAGAEGPFGA